MRKFRLKRASALLLTIAMITSTMVIGLTGCGSDNSASTSTTEASSGATGTAAVSDSAKKVYPQFTIWMGTEEKKCPEITAVQKVFKEKLGFDFKIQSRQGDLMTALNLKLNSGGFEDVALIYKDAVAVNAFVKSGMVQEVSQYLQMPDKYPNLAKMPDSVKNISKTTDGKLWYIPGWYAQEQDDPWPGWAAASWWPRIDLVEKVGMKMEDLSTIEGVEKYLRAVSKLKDSSGKSIIPLGFYINDGNTVNDEEAIILSTFGVDATRGNSKMPGVVKNGNNFVFNYDDPNFKNAYIWMNKMYREGLIDIEVPTQKVERYKEKINAGRYGMIAGTIWKSELTNAWAALNGPTNTTWYFQPMKSPAVKGVEKSAAIQAVNPNPSACIFISKDTKNIDSILRFVDWCQEADPKRQQEINEGPLGINWNWTGSALGEWDFTAEYGKERNSGDSARVDVLTPQLWAMGTYSKKWYPWWTNKIADNQPKGMKLTNKYVQDIANNNGIVRKMHAYDNVTAVAGGTLEKNLPSLNAVYIEYRARLMMARNDAEFESTWTKFQEQLENRAHWSDMKAEWNQQYKEYLKTNPDF